MKPQRLPPPKQKPGQEEQPKLPPQKNPEEILAKLEESRKALYASVLDFKSLLKDYELSANRTSDENKARQELLVKLNNQAGQLEYLNAGEGLMTLTITALNCVTLLQDQINDLRYQNAVLNKKVKA